MADYETFQHDVLVIGAGGAGLRAAIEASAAGVSAGLEMIRTLQDHGVHQGIEVYMEHTILALLKNGERVVGAFGYERERGRFRIFRAKAIVLATGGIGRAYKITSNSWESTGDGLA